MSPIFRPSPETFEVEEIAAYEPCGQGQHTFLWIEKRDLTTNEAANRLARAFGVRPGDVGFAGQKDRHATTRQWLSVPDLPPERALAAEIPGLVIQRAVPHGNKLRIGHVRGNRFRVTLLDVSDSERAAIETAFARFASDGLPNQFGFQRFGSRGDNVERALAILRGEIRERDHRHRRFLYSALQSEIFNRVLEQRTTANTLRRVLEGDVLRKTDTGGLFATTDTAADQQRLDQDAVGITGPLPGNRVLCPPPGTAAAALEDEAAGAVGLSAAHLASAGRDMPGDRRPLLVPVTEPLCRDPGTQAAPPGADGAETAPGAQGTLELRFALPAGSYASVLVEALGVSVDQRRGAPPGQEPGPPPEPKTGQIPSQGP